MSHLGRAVEHVCFWSASLDGSLPDQLPVGADATACLTVTRRSWLVVDCVLAPDGTAGSDARQGTPISLTITATSPGLTTPCRTTITLDASTPAVARRLTLALPASSEHDVTLTLTARSTPPRASAGAHNATTLLVQLRSPRLLSPRSAAEMFRLARAVFNRDGWSGILRRTTLAAPRTDPQADYRRWLAAHPLTDEQLDVLRRDVQALPMPPRFSIITPVYNTEARWLRACVESVCAQVYPHWELLLVDDASTREGTRQALQDIEGRDARIRIIRRATNGHISQASNDGLAAATGEFIALLDHDDTLTPDALAEMARAITADPQLDFLYSDEDKLDEAGGRCDPFFKPDWSPEHFLNVMYTNHLMVLRRALVEAVGGFRIGYEGSQDYDLALRIITRTSRVGHVPKILYHWRKIPGSAAAEPEAKPWAVEAARRALADHVARTEPESEVLMGASRGLFRVKRPVRDQPLVSLVVLTADGQRELRGRVTRLLPHLLTSIAARTTYRHIELVIGHSVPLSPESSRALAAMTHVLVDTRPDGPFNFARALNVAARVASGEHLVLLNDDMEVVSPDWIEALLEYSQDPAIGAVGSRLLYPDGRLQHIGVVLGVNGIAAHAFHQGPPQHPGHFGSSLGPRNYSAVTAACMMTRREVFERLHGFDERLAIDFNDIDYCLRVRQQGLRVVYTPYAELYHLESSSFTERVWRPEALELMRSRWPDALERDPYYNPNLTRHFADYRLGA